MLFGYKIKPTFTVENEQAIAAPPTVDFDTPAPEPAPAVAPEAAPTPAPAAPASGSGSLSPGY
jgi:LemA protein